MQQFELTQVMIREIVSLNPQQFAVHANRSSIAGSENVHLHSMFSDIMPDGFERAPDAVFKRYNAKHPEPGGCKKVSGGKNRLEIRDELIETRPLVARMQHGSLARYVHETRVDHR